MNMQRWQQVYKRHAKMQRSAAARCPYASTPYMVGCMVLQVGMAQMVCMHVFTCMQLQSPVAFAIKPTSNHKSICAVQCKAVAALQNGTLAIPIASCMQCANYILNTPKFAVQAASGAWVQGVCASAWSRHGPHPSILHLGHCCHLHAPGPCSSSTHSAIILLAACPWLHTRWHASSSAGGRGGSAGY